MSSSSQNSIDSNNIGGSGGTTGKRKRNSDNGSEEGGDNVHRGGDGGSVSPSPVPDAAVSSSTHDPLEELELPPNGEFPSFDQLFKILTFIEAYATGSSRHRPDDAIKALKYLDRCMLNEEDTQHRSSFKDSFARLSGPLRLIQCIKLQMDDENVVTWAAKSSANYFNDTNRYSLSQLQKTAIESILYQDGIKILVLSVESLLPSGNKQHLEATRCVWGLIRNLIGSMQTDSIDKEHLIYVLEAVADFQLLRSCQTYYLTIRIAGFMAHSAVIVLQTHSTDEEMLKIVREGHMVEELCELCQIHCSEWLTDRNMVNLMLSFFVLFACDERLPSGKLLKTLPLILKALCKYHNDYIIEIRCFTIIDTVESTVNHRELEGMPILSTLSGVIESRDSSEAVKTKCRGLLRKLTA